MSQKKITALTSMGAGFEYYDFIIFGMLTPFIAQNFFPRGDASWALINTFAIFAMGYVVRPLGGFIFGHLGDRFGRKKSMVTAMLLMAVSVLVIGFLPTYSDVGITATMLLLACRLVQGFSLGAELPSAITFLNEHAEDKDRGLRCGWMIASISLGATLGAVVNYLLTHLLSAQEMFFWGWRLPFLLGGVLALIGMMGRKQLPETKAFERVARENKKANMPIWELRHYGGNILIGVSITIFAAAFIIFGLFLPSYLHHYYNYPLQSVYLAMTLGLVWSAVFAPIIGRISDHFGQDRVMLVSMLIMLLFGVFLFKLFSYGSFNALFGFMFLYEAIATAMAVCYFAMLSKLFPAEVRSTGVGVCYNVAYLLAGFTPALLGYLLQRAGGHTIITTFFFLALALVSLISALFWRRRTVVSEAHSAS